MYVVEYIEENLMLANYRLLCIVQYIYYKQHKTIFHLRLIHLTVFLSLPAQSLAIHIQV